MAVNKVILLGNLGQDPETKQVNDSVSLTTFSLATSEKYNGKTETTWHKVKVFGKTGEVIAQYHSKGDQIYIEGKIKNGKYENKEGQTIHYSEVIGYSFSFVGGNKTSKVGESSDNTASECDIPF